ncbi:pentatricopeptide repeat-containing protein At1g62930, chloroplastic-like [Arachis ipaensis]|nr:pentatricopeptide repeat-containing protein At1g62930, chloroplastic-like [Arachis ipaensis]
MINGLCKSKRVDEALNLFEEMCRKNLVPDTVTYSTLIDGLGKSRRILCALELLGKMHDRGLPADIVTYSSLMDALFNIKQHDKALMLFNQMKESGTDLDIYTYNILIDGLCKSGRLKNGKRHFSRSFRERLSSKCDDIHHYDQWALQRGSAS